MKIKIGCIIFVLSFILCGCSATYNIEITNNKVIEDFSFMEEASKKSEKAVVGGNIEGTEYESTGDTYENLVNSELRIETQAFASEGSKYYKKTLINSEKYGINYKYSFDIDDYSRSYIANSSTMMFNFMKDNGTIYLSAPTGIAKDYFENFSTLDNITIHIKSSYKVKNNNADRVDNNDYYWDITRSNYQDKKVYIELDKNKEVHNYEGKYTSYLIVGLCIAIFAFIVIIFLNKKRKKINKI